MSTRTGLPFRLSLALGALMAVQSALGLALPHAYRDTGYVSETWFGNDLVTLALGVPLLTAGLILARRGSLRGRLLWLGALGYALYNYAFYLFGAALNPFFALYVAALVLAAVTIIIALSRTNVEEAAARFDGRTPVRLVGGYLLCVALGLTVVWLGMWAAHVFGGRPTPGSPETFKLVVALDLTIMVPALSSGGVLLWWRRPWGYVIAAMASIQGALYLCVLALNGVLFIVRGLAEAPGELPVWGSLCVATVVAAALLLSHARSSN